MRVEDYDRFGFSYQDYWTERQYEHLAEMLALTRLLRPERGWLADFGAGFGRLGEAYAGTHEGVVLVDYSLALLRQAQRRLGGESRNRLWVAANLYHLPFRTGVLTTGLMVRVLHHLAASERALAEVGRVIQKQWVLEVPNKRHGLARVRSGLGRGTRGEIRGWHAVNIATEPGGVFLNYHPPALIRSLRRKGWQMESVRSLSNFRSACLKRLLPAPLLAKLDFMVQTPAGTLGWGPSMMYRLTRPYQPAATTPEWPELLCCPACRGTLLTPAAERMDCASCLRRYVKTGGIWDLRWPPAGGDGDRGGAPRD
ncbi:MAG: methyltransferase domain-containing protein [Thermaerobacter sp.]|nr:methyltransferase domain-containing protein [Thermaerobacter sp.]